MVGEVERAGLVAVGPVAYHKAVVGSEGVADLHVDVAREAVQSLLATETHGQGTVSPVNYVPDQQIDTLEASVEGLAVIVLRESVFDPIDAELSVGDAVRHRSHRRAEETLAAVMHIFLQTVVAQNHVLQFPVAVRSPETYNPAAVIGRLERELSASYRAEFNLLSVNRFREILLGNEHRSVSGAAGGRNQGRTDNDSVSHIVVICSISVQWRPS